MGVGCGSTLIPGSSQRLRILLRAMASTLSTSVRYLSSRPLRSEMTLGLVDELRKKLWCLPGRLGNLSLSLGNFSRSCGTHARAQGATGHTRQQTRHNVNKLNIHNGVLGVGLSTVACANRGTATTRDITGPHHRHHVVVLWVGGQLNAHN